MWSTEIVHVLVEAVSYQRIRGVHGVSISSLILSHPKYRLDHSKRDLTDIDTRGTIRAQGQSRARSFSKGCLRQLEPTACCDLTDLGHILLYCK